MSGELDIASSQMLEETLTTACSGGAKELVLDLGGLEFMDSTGLNALLTARRVCEEHGCSYWLTPAQRQVDRVFQTTGVRGRLHFRAPHS